MKKGDRRALSNLASRSHDKDTPPNLVKVISSVNFPGHRFIRYVILHKEMQNKIFYQIIIHQTRCHNAPNVSQSMLKSFAGISKITCVPLSHPSKQYDLEKISPNGFHLAYILNAILRSSSAF
jgi:hypothetical protein